MCRRAAGGDLRGGSYWGSRSSPPSWCVLFFIVIESLLFLLLALPGLPWLTGCSLERGANSKRISLDADAALINQFRRCLEAVLLFSAWSLGRTPCGNSSPKESVSCASAVLFLLCVSRFVLFLFWIAVLVIVLLERSCVWGLPHSQAENNKNCTKKQRLNWLDRTISITSATKAIRLLFTPGLGVVHKL